MSVFAGLLVVLLIGLVLGPAEADPPAISTGSRKSHSRKKDLLREGKRLEQVAGRFEPTGDRFTFVVEDSSRRFLVLENLNLERIAKMRGVYPVPIRWTITGVITEYEDENFLLIETAQFSSLFRKNTGGSEKTEPGPKR